MSAIQKLLHIRLETLLKVARKTGKIRLVDIKRMIGVDLVNRVNLNVVTRYLYGVGIDIEYQDGEMGIPEICRELKSIKRKRGFITRSELSALLVNEHLNPVMNKILAMINQIKLEIVEDDYIETVVLPAGLPYDEICSHLVECHWKGEQITEELVRKILKPYGELPFSIEKIRYILSEYGVEFYNPEREEKRERVMEEIFSLVEEKGYILETFFSQLIKEYPLVHRENVLVYLLERGIEVFGDHEFLKRKEIVLKKILVKTKGYYEDYGFFTEKFLQESEMELKKWEISREECLNFFKDSGMNPEKHKKAHFLRKSA